MIICQNCLQSTNPWIAGCFADQNKVASSQVSLQMDSCSGLPRCKMLMCCMQVFRKLTTTKKHCFGFLMIRKASCLRSPGLGLDPHPVEMRIAWSTWLDSMLGQLLSRTRDLHWWYQWWPQTLRFYLHWCLPLRGSTFPLKHYGSTVRCRMQYSRTKAMTWKQEWGPLQLGLGQQEYYSLRTRLLLRSWNSCTIKWAKSPSSIVRLAFQHIR